MKTKKWKFNIKSPHVYYIGEKISSDEVIADTEEKAIEIMCTAYDVQAKRLELIEVQDIELYGDKGLNPVGFVPYNIFVY